MRKTATTLILLALCVLVAAPAMAANVVRISQVYGGGGNSGAQYSNDFVELYNSGLAPVDISGWSLQYGSATGGDLGTCTNCLTTLPTGSVIQPCGYFLIQLAAGSTPSGSLPTPDYAAPAATANNLSATNGKIGLKSNAVTTPCSPQSAFVDLVGWGTANCFEGAGATPGLSNTTAALRNGGGTADSDNNNLDFTTPAPAPRNSASPKNPDCLNQVVPLDHYHTYKVEQLITSGQVVTLRDQFGVETVPVRYLDQFANPVSKNGEGIQDPLTHLSWWVIDYPEPERRVLMHNQFGDQDWKVGNARYLLAPARKSRTQPPTEPLPTNRNHFKCYEVLSGPVLQKDVVLDDQFGHRTAVVDTPRYLCNPAEKRTQTGLIFPIVDPVTHLACYDLRPIQPYNIPVFIHDQFFASPSPINLLYDLLLCVPSQKEIVVPTEKSTWGRLKGQYR